MLFLCSKQNGDWIWGKIFHRNKEKWIFWKTKMKQIFARQLKKYFYLVCVTDESEIIWNEAESCQASKWIFDKQEIMVYEIFTVTVQF